MARRASRLLPTTTLDTFKYEVASDLGLLSKIQTMGWPEIASKECGQVGGKIGGNMVKAMIRYAQETLTNPEY